MRRLSAAIFMMASIVAAIPRTVEAVELRVSYSPANFSAMYNAIATEFMKANPEITIKFEPAKSYDELLQNTLRANLINDAPDVSHQGLNYIRLLADRGLALPLNRFISTDVEWKQHGVLDSIRNIGSIGDKAYAVPFSLTTPVLFYNIALVVRAGANPANLPVSWDGVFDLAKKISGLEPNVSGLYMDYNANGAWGFETLLFAHGGRMMTREEDDITFDQREGLAAMTSVARAAEAGMIDLSRDNARQSFVAGKIGIYLSSSSLLTDLDRQIDQHFLLTMMPIPLAHDGKTLAAGNGMVMLTKDSIRQEAAWKYMKFAASPQAQAIMAAMTGYTPVNTAALSDPRLQTLYREKPNYEVPLRQLGELAPWYAFPGENSTKAAAMIVDKMQLVLGGKASAQAALEDAAKEARRLILKK
ncbi:extracellular solute-binding protein [Bradyrhizobium uaiense]|uniref:sn-glycerol-3-phosphate-binding periplasmic protein UgpB n=1 Tax=Bradyrhizobium uaiense TaxID=2594946 RepID=A0A6P1BSL8_9BRAD|nr:extracellular solute-binding protein [Bradyrhizobium uaiense]NEV01160.1 extracellular solute-binding protein [Bradyrhizobium uaiense]